MRLWLCAAGAGGRYAPAAVIRRACARPLNFTLRTSPFSQHLSVISGSSRC